MRSYITQEAASAESEAQDRVHFNGQRRKRGCVNKQRGARVRINDPRGTRGHGNNIEAQKVRVNDQRGTILRSRFGNTMAVGSSSMVSEAVPQEAASAKSRRKSPHQ